MSLSAIITPAVLDKVLGTLALLFLASTGGDLTAARHAASRLLACHDVETEEELRLAADIVSFGFHALDALGQSMAPDLPLKEVIRLRGSACSLNRQSHSSQRKLDQLRRDRLAAAQAEEPEPVEPPPIDPAASLSDIAREAVQVTAAKGGSPAQGFFGKQRHAARLIAENLARNKSEHACRQALASGFAQPAAAPLQATG
jgi:hypothetical protein